MDNVLFGKYKVVALLGSGGYSSVWLVKHMKLGYLRAVKIISKDNVLHDRLIKEAYILRDIHHECIPGVYDIEEDDANSYIIEDYCKGVSLKEDRRLWSDLDIARIINYIMQICDLIDYLHDNGRRILYLDMKPENLIVYNSKLMLIDFGAAMPADDVENMEFSMGTRGFAAPEQYTERKPDIRSDIYGIGKILHFLIYGTVSAAKKAEIPSNTGGWEALINIMNKCLQKEPDKRYENVKDVLRDLEICRRDNLKIINFDEFIAKLTHRKGYLQDLKNKQGKLTDKMLIGVAATHRGAGATHLSLLMGYFFHDKLKKKTLIIEKDKNEDMRKLSDDYGSEYFVKNGISFMIYAGRYGEIKKKIQEYEVVIMDFGRMQLLDINDFLAMDRHFVATSIAEWKFDRLLDFHDRFSDMPNYGEWIYMTICEDEKKIATIRDFYGIHIENCGFVPSCENMPNDIAKKFIRLF